PVPGKQPDVGALLEREQTDAIELPLEDPFGSAEPLLRERGRHRLDPVGKARRHAGADYSKTADRSEFCDSSRRARRRAANGTTARRICDRIDKIARFRAVAPAPAAVPGHAVLPLPAPLH